MKRVILFLLMVFLGWGLVGCNETINPIDEITLYEIQIDPRDDGSIDMTFHIKWKVLDDDSEGPLEWVRIGIPNYHVDEMKAISSNIERLEYSSSGGAFIEVYFNETIYEGYIIDFSFSSHQSYLYKIEDGFCQYSYQPGWFDSIRVERAVVRWHQDGILEANPNRLEGEYLVWDMPLDFGETIDVTVRYSSSHFPNLEVGAQYTGDSMPPREIIVLIAVLVAIVVIIIVAIVVKKNLEDPYYSYRGFCGRHHYYYFGNYNLFRRQGVNAEGKKITNPTTFRSGGLGGGGSSCACACACACAGGGRAGCSRKDFTQSAVDVEQMKHMDN